MKLHILNYGYSNNMTPGSFLDEPAYNPNLKKSKRKHKRVRLGEDQRLLLLYLTPKIGLPHKKQEFHDNRQKKKRPNPLEFDPNLEDILHELGVLKETIVNSAIGTLYETVSNKLLTGVVYFRNGKFDFVHERDLNLTLRLNQLSYEDASDNFYGLKQSIESKDLRVSRLEREFYSSLTKKLVNDEELYSFLLSQGSASKISKELNREEGFGFDPLEVYLETSLIRNFVFYRLVRSSLPIAKWPSSTENDKVLYILEKPSLLELKDQQRIVQQPRDFNSFYIKRANFALLVKTNLEEISHLLGNNNYDTLFVYRPKKDMNIVIK